MSQHNHTFPHTSTTFALFSALRNECHHPMLFSMHPRPLTYVFSAWPAFHQITVDKGERDDLWRCFDQIVFPGSNKYYISSSVRLHRLFSCPLIIRSTQSTCRQPHRCPLCFPTNSLSKSLQPCPKSRFSVCCQRNKSVRKVRK